MSGMTPAETATVRPNPKHPDHFPSIGEEVHAYRNLDKRNPSAWSIRTRRPGSGWQVGAYADAVGMTGVTARQPTAAGLRKIERRGRRDVVAWFVGALVATDDGVTVHGDTERIRFNPFVDVWFHIDGVRFDGASQTYLDTDGTAYAAR